MVKVLEVMAPMTVAEVLAEAEEILDKREIRVNMTPATVATEVQPGQQVMLVPKVKGA